MEEVLKQTFDFEIIEIFPDEEFSNVIIRFRDENKKAFEKL